MSEMKSITLNGKKYDSFVDKNAVKTINGVKPDANGNVETVTGEQIEKIEQEQVVLSERVNNNTTEIEQIKELTENLVPTESSEIEALVLSILGKYMEEHSQEMASLYINGHEYNGSEEVAIEMSGGGGGDSNETYALTTIASGTIEANAAIAVETGVTIDMLREYKTFCVRFAGSSNTAISNVYFYFGNSFAANSGCVLQRSSDSGAMSTFEFIGDKQYARRIGACHGNPSIILKPGSNVVATPLQTNLSNVDVGVTFINTEEAEEKTLKIYSQSTPTISYTWEVIGLTK